MEKINHICPKCNFYISNSIEKHINFCDGRGPRRKIKRGQRGGWNKDIDYKKVFGKEWTDIYIDKLRKSAKLSFKRGDRKKLSEEQEIVRRNKISTKMKEVGGGYRRGSGRGKKGTYKGYWCDSSYELAWVIYHLEKNIEFERNNQKFKYLYMDVEEKNYIPDFKIGETFYELKGYKDDSVEYKIKYFPFTLKILFEKDLKYIFDYVISKYGKNFISLYEDKEYKSCKECCGYVCKTNKSLICKNCFTKNSKNIKKNGKSVNPFLRSIKNCKNRLCECGEQIKLKSKNCRNCSNIKKRKILNRPNLKELSKEINEIGYSAVGRKYGVSDNCIRKWIRKSINDDC